MLQKLGLLATRSSISLHYLELRVYEAIIPPQLIGNYIVAAGVLWSVHLDGYLRAIE